MVLLYLGCVVEEVECEVMMLLEVVLFGILYLVWVFLYM